MPTRARLLFGSFGFSTRRMTLPAASTSATPKDDGFGTSFSITDAATFGLARKRSTRRGWCVPMRLSPRYITKSEPSQEAASASRRRARGPPGRSCGMKVNFAPNAEPSPSAAWISRAGLRADDDADVGDRPRRPGCRRRRRAPGGWRPGRAASRRCGERTQPRARAAREDESLHGDPFSRPRRSRA